MKVTLRVVELDNHIILENVDLLNSRNGIHPNSLKGALEPFVICCGGLMNCLLLSITKGNCLRIKIQPME